MASTGERGGERGRGAWTTRTFARFCAGAALIFGVLGAGPGDAATGDRALKLYNTHTKERAIIVFKRNGSYDKAGLSKMNQFLRDWRKNRPTTMDPKLLDLVWEVYEESGSDDYIHVVCGYRSPETNGALRRRSKGVAKNSQHMKGKALDFFIPDVTVAKIRAIGLRQQVGGVGFYPSSNFVHLDTGSVRHWPRMTRKQLVAVFPEGRTLHVPSDGKPLPGYSQALAGYKARSGAPVAVASISDDEDEDQITIASVPTPRISPARDGPEVVAMFEGNEAFAPVAPNSMFKGKTVVLTPSTPMDELVAAHIDFDAAFDISGPDVPVALAETMAARDQAEPAPPAGTSLPIAPTAVVETVITRPLRAAAITTAVLRKDGDRPPRPMPEVLAFAPSMDALPPEKPRTVHASAMGGVPIPQTKPLHVEPAAEVEAVAAVSLESVYARLAVSELTLTALDTQGLRMWIATPSTREKRYALLTMPDFSQVPALLDKPEVAYAAGFGEAAYVGLRTDTFSGPLVEQPTVVDLAALATIAAR